MKIEEAIKIIQENYPINDDKLKEAFNLAFLALKSQVEAYLIEYRADRGDYPDIEYKCSNCGEYIEYEGENYCSNCGAKFNATKIKRIPESKCRLCNFSITGLKEDCNYNKYHNNINCKWDKPKWITYNKDNPFEIYGECSNCGYTQSVDKYWKYCPNCGAEMEIDINEQLEK